MDVLRLEGYYNFCHLYHNFCYLFIVVAFVVIVEFGYSVPAFLHRYHHVRLRACRLWSKNPEGLKCRENGVLWPEFSPDSGLLAHVWAVSYYWLYVRALPKATKLQRDSEVQTSLQHADLPRDGWDFSAWPATMNVKLGINPFTTNIPLSLFGLTKSKINLPRAETLRGDNCRMNISFQLHQLIEGYLNTAHV